MRWSRVHWSRVHWSCPGRVRPKYPLLDDPAGSARLAEDARRRLAHGDPAEALALGRDLHWASAGDPVRESLANELPVGAYQALGRPSLAGIAQAHHDHRDLRDVIALGSRQGMSDGS